MEADFDPGDLERRLEGLLEVLPSERTRLPGLPDKKLKKLRAAVGALITALENLDRWLDPVEHPDAVFDPSDPRDAAAIIQMVLEQRDRRTLSSIKAMYGGGVYALYYAGEHPAYAAIKNSQIPIYVGKADPKDHRASKPTLQGTQLFERLRQHTKNIQRAERYAAQSEGLVYPIVLDEFECRYLVTPGVYVESVEKSLIKQYEPVWNTICRGFGKHGDDPNTRANERSHWDTLHPGRAWATREENVANARTAAEIQGTIIEHLRKIVERRG